MNITRDTRLIIDKIYMYIKNINGLLISSKISSI